MYLKEIEVGNQSSIYFRTLTVIAFSSSLHSISLSSNHTKHKTTTNKAQNGIPLFFLLCTKSYRQKLPYYANGMHCALILFVETQGNNRAMCGKRLVIIFGLVVFFSAFSNFLHAPNQQNKKQGVENSATFLANLPLKLVMAIRPSLA